MTIEELLIKHEGIKLAPYKDTAGKTTIGIGRNLEDVGISKEEALLLLENDLKKIDRITENIFWFHKLSENRQNVIISMIFNMGYSRFSQFKKMIFAIQNEDFTGAAEEMLDSSWSKQVGQRSRDLADMMIKG